MAESRSKALDTIDASIRQMDEAIAELEVCHAEARDVLIRSGPEDREKLELAVQTVRNKIEDGKQRRQNIWARRERLRRITALLQEGESLQREGAELSEEERKGERAEQMRQRISEIKAELETLKKP